MMDEMRARTADDTVADDCATGFLGELDEVLWIADELEKAEESAFRHAFRKAEHVREFRRILYRLHVLLAAWEQEVGVSG